MSTPVAQDLEPHRRALLGHCYRMLGSVVDAEDAVQETMLRAWKALPGFDGRSALGTWLYRIATNVCLDERQARTRRAHPRDEGPAAVVSAVTLPLPERPRSHWLEPVPDAAALPADTDADPAHRAVLKESIRLAFVAALQHLPPRQRAALLLTEVLGWSAAEVAGTLETTVASVNSALQRARATLSTRPAIERQAPLPEQQAALLDRFVDAFLRYDVDGLAALLHQDVVMTMPPFALWLQGPASIQQWMLGPGAGCRDSRLVPTMACGSPAFAQYRQAGQQAWGLIVLELDGDRIAGWNTYLDTATLFPRFGLPMTVAP